MITRDVLPTLTMGVDNLFAHKLRSLLTMLGMIFGVAAVVAMLSIGAGAQQQVMAMIEAMGVRNLIVESRPAPDQQAFQRLRQVSAGLSLADMRVIQSTVDGVGASTARKRFTPSKLIPKPFADTPTVFGVEPTFQGIAGLEIAEGRFITADDNAAAAPVAVLGEGARIALFGGRAALGEHVKVNEQWLRVVGVCGSVISAQNGSGGGPAEDRNNLIYVPLRTAILRLEDSASQRQDEIDGIYLQMSTADATVPASRVVRRVLGETHRGADDFTLVVPSELLAEQRRTQRIFELVMVAIASISLLVGGIGIMNIMLASVLERTREIGVRRAVGARRREIIRQFLLEATLISCAGGIVGVVAGVLLSWIIGRLAGWTTVVSLASIVLAFSVSVAIGLIFGVYPARKAAALDPVEALHYEWPVRSRMVPSRRGAGRARRRARPGDRPDGLTAVAMAPAAPNMAAPIRSPERPAPASRRHDEREPDQGAQQLVHREGRPPSQTLPPAQSSQGATRIDMRRAGLSRSPRTAGGHPGWTPHSPPCWRRPTAVTSRQPRPPSPCSTRSAPPRAARAGEARTTVDARGDDPPARGLPRPGAAPRPAIPGPGRFMGYAAKAMRGLIVDYVRRRQALKRGGHFEITALETDVADPAAPSDLGGLGKRSRRSPRSTGGWLRSWTSSSSAASRSLRSQRCTRSRERTVERDWEKARLFLHQALRDGGLPD